MLRALRNIAFDVNANQLSIEMLDETLSPFHDRDGLAERRVEIEIIQLGHSSEPVRIDVHKCWAVATRGVFARNDKCWGRDRADDIELCCDPLHKGRLAGSEDTNKEHHISGTQTGRRPRTQRSHLLSVGHLDGWRLLHRSGFQPT